LPKVSQFDKSSQVTVRNDDADELIKDLGRLPDIIAAIGDAQEGVNAVLAVQAAFLPEPPEEPGEGVPEAPAATPVQAAPQPQPVQAQPQQGTFELCPIHNIPKDRWVPSGTSRAGRAYPAFWACPVPGCKGR
jgi:hypothetical protein